MALTYDYLEKKASACGDIINRLDSVIRDGVAQSGGKIKPHIKNIRQLQHNLTIKKHVIDLMATLHLPNSLDVTEDTFKPIHRVLFNCAYDPQKSTNKLLMPIYKNNLRHEQRQAIVALIDLLKKAPNAGDRQLLAKRMVSQLVRERSSRLDPSNVENIVLAGGGAKGFSLAKIPEALTDNGVDNLKRIAGTSAGAILGSMMAFGYSGKELENLVLKNQFGLFTKDSRLSVNFIERIAENSDNPVLMPFSDNAYASDFHKFLVAELLCRAANRNIKLPGGIENDVREFYKENIAADTSCPEECSLEEREAFVEQMTDARRSQMRNLHDKVITFVMKNDKYAEILENIFNTQLPHEDRRISVDLATRMAELSYDKGQRYFSQLYPNSKQAVRFAMRDLRGKDMIVGYLEDLIEHKLRQVPQEVLEDVFLSAKERSQGVSVNTQMLRRISFEQLKSLHDIFPDKFKEFYCTIAIKKPITERVGTLLIGKYSRYDHHDVSHKHDSLSSMAVADAVRVSMNLPGIYPSYPFEVKGKKYRGADGGVISNLSIQVFDDHFAPEKTMCVIYASDKKMRAAENLYQLLMHPRSVDEIERDIQVSQLSIREISEKRRKLSNMVKNQQSKLSGMDSEDFRKKILHSAEQRLDKIEDNLNSMRFRRAVLDHEKENAESRGWSPFSIANSLASKRYRGQYLPQDLNRTVLVNTGEVNTLDFKLEQQKKQALMESGFESANDVLSGRDDLELNFLRNKCTEYEHILSMDKIGIMRDYIYQEKSPDNAYMDTIRFVFSVGVASGNKSYHNEAIETINEILYDGAHKLPERRNHSLVMARSAWRDAQMSHRPEYVSHNLKL